MFSFDIKNYSKNSNILYLRLPNIFYISFSLISILLISGLFFYSVDIVPMILSIISLIILTVREEWIFNRESNKIVYIRGAFFIYKRSTFNFSDIEDIETSSIVKGKRESSDKDKLPFYFRRYYSLKLNFKSESFIILTLPERKKESIDKIYKFIK